MFADIFEVEWNGACDIEGDSTESLVKDYAKSSGEDKKLLVSLADVFARIPELKGLYETVLTRKSMCMTLVGDVFKNMKDRPLPLDVSAAQQVPEPGHFWFQLVQTGKLTETQVKEWIPPVTELIQEKVGEDWRGKVSHTDSKPWSKTLPTYHSTLAGTANIWIPPLLGEIYEPLCIHMMALYQLSIFARYRPAIWHEILEGNQDQYRGLIESYSGCLDAWVLN